LFLAALSRIGFHKKEDKMKKGYVPIKLNEFVEKHIKSNPDTSRKEIETGLKAALNDYVSNHNSEIYGTFLSL
jgi:hypothetical protein